MLENLYTTKMNIGKKKLKNRLLKIRSQNGKASKTLSLIMTLFIITAILCTSVVMSIIDSRAKPPVISLKVPEINALYAHKTVGENKNHASEVLQQSVHAVKEIKSEAKKQNMQPSKCISKEIYDKELDFNTEIADSVIAVSDENIFKSAAVSDELYIGFEQIILKNTDLTGLQKELNKKGITESQNTHIDLQSNYIVKDFTADKTQVTADENGNISIYLSVDNDNLFDVYITNSDTNEDVGQYSVLANNENVYSFLGFEKEQNYDIEVKSKTQNDWIIEGNYIIY